MKKLITILSLLVVAASLTAQSWATYYNTTPLDSVTGNNQLLFIVEDADSTHVLYFSTLESIFEGQLNNEAGLYSALSDVTQFLEEGDNATLLNGAPYTLLYVDANGDVTELTLGADGTYLMSNGAAAVPTWETVGEGSMTYPAAGIALSTGTAWGTSITDNSANWETAFGWGDHSAIGYLTAVAISDITATGTPSASTYLTGAGTWATPAGSGDLVSTNNLSDVDDAATALSNLGGLAEADTLQVSFSDGLDTVTSAGVLTVTWDSTAVYDYIDTEVAGGGGGSAELDSTDLAFKHEVYPIHTFTTPVGIDWTTVVNDWLVFAPFFNRGYDTLVITSIVPSIYNSSSSEDTVQFQILYNDTLGNTSAEAVPLMESSPMEVISDANGYSGLIEYTDIVNDTIPPDVWVWGRLVGANSTDQFTGSVYATMSGYKVKGTFDENPFDSDVTAPLYSSSELGTYNDTIILVLFDTTDVDQSSVPAVSAFSFYGGNTEIGLNAVTMNEDSLFVALDSTLTVFDDSTLYLSYTVPGTNPLQDSSGNEVVAWVDSVVSNNLAAPTGENIITNGTFETISSWTTSGGWSISGGAANFDGATSYSHIAQSNPSMQSSMAASTNYTIEFTTAGGSITMSIQNSDGTKTNVSGTSYAAGSHSIDFTTASDDTSLGIRFRVESAGTSDAITLDDVTLFVR